MHALVIGAGGFLGLNLVDALQAAGVDFICGTRRRAPRIALRRRGVDLVHLDLDVPESLDAAMAGVHTVYHLAGHYPALSVDAALSISLGLRQMKTVLNAAATSGVQRLVYVSSTATVAPAPSGPSTEEHRFDRAPEGVYHGLKWQLEQLALAETRFEVRVACPGACIGPWDQRVGTSAPLVALANGLRPLLPDGILNVVDVRDVALGCVALGTLNTAPKRVLLVAENLQLVPFLRRIARRYQVGDPVQISAGRALRFADEEEQRCAAQGGRPALSREIVDLILAGVPIDSRCSRDELGLSYRAFEHTLCAFEEWARARRLLPRVKESSDVQQP